MTRKNRFPWAAAVIALGCAATLSPSLTRGQGPGFGPPGAGVMVSPEMLPVPPTGPGHAIHGQSCGCGTCGGGPLKRAVHHVLFTLKDKFIGYPDQFVEPPLGFYRDEHINAMRAKADPHQFFLYQSDFVKDQTALSPTGAQRLTLMANRLNCWLGPLVVEWTPEKPALAEARKASIYSALANAGIGIDPDRILIGPSPYPGLLGDVAERYYPVLIERSVAAPAMYTLPPQPPIGSTGGMSGGGGSGAGGGGLGGGIR